MYFCLEDVCLISSSVGTVLTLFASFVKDLVRKANLALCDYVHKTFLMTFCRVGTSLDVSGQVNICGNPV